MARAITYRDKFDKRIDKVQGNFLGGKHLSNGCEMTPRSNAKRRPESKDITPRSVKTREALLWSKGLGVGNWQTKTFLSVGIMMVLFPGLNWHRRAKVPLQMVHFSLNIRACSLYVIWEKTRPNLGKKFLHHQKYALPYTYAFDNVISMMLKTFLYLVHKRLIRETEAAVG